MNEPTQEQLLERFELEYACAQQRAAESRIEIAALEARTGEPLTEASVVVPKEVFEYTPEESRVG